MDFQVNMGHCL